MTVIMKKYSEICIKGTKQNYVAQNNFNMFFSRYETILHLFHSVNSVLSIPIFLLCIFYSTVIFFGITIFIQSSFPPILIYFTLTSILTFTAITLAASDVDEADKNAKKLNIVILCHINPENRNSSKVSFDVLSQKYHEPPFIISAWEFFYFTKDFISMQLDVY